MAVGTSRIGDLSGDPEWNSLGQSIVACQLCPRLIEHCRSVARLRRRAYRDQTYWGRPVPGFGDRDARIMMLGLAPGAHGANRTGRMFTGDRSGDWLYGALHRAGLADRPESVARDDGLTLRDVFISGTCRCAPPGNRPTRQEMDRCAPFLDRELEMLAGLRVVVALGQIAWEAALRCSARVAPAQPVRPRHRFGHGAEASIRLRGGADPAWLLGSYHPSQQNTQTGRLTRPMFDSVIARAVELAAPEA